MLMFRILAATACLSLMLAEPVLARSGKETIKVPDTQLRSLTIEPAQVIRFRTQKQAVGQLAFNEDTSTIVLTPFAGRVTKIFGKIGDTVAVNAPLFEIDSPEVVQMQTDLIAALNAVEKARSQLALTKRILDRQSSLVAERAAAMRELDQARADHAAAESDLRTAEGSVAAARNKLRVLVGRNDEEMARIERERMIDPLVIVRAPIAGQIVARKIGLGQLVRPDQTESLFSIADLATMWLRVAVAENDIPLVRVGQELEVHIDALPASTFKAKVNAIGSASDAVTRRIMVRSELANPEQILRPEMFATFKIFVGEGDEWPAVSVESIIREANRSFIYIEVKPGEFQRRLVTLGAEQNGRVAVREGLQPGERVVGRGAIFLDNEWKQ
jgi:cobalt-zinc-cadmium efflux system membrane fusion protein